MNDYKEFLTDGEQLTLEETTQKLSKYQKLMGVAQGALQRAEKTLQHHMQQQPSLRDPQGSWYESKRSLEQNIEKNTGDLARYKLLIRGAEETIYLYRTRGYERSKTNQDMSSIEERVSEAVVIKLVEMGVIDVLKT